MSMDSTNFADSAFSNRLTKDIFSSSQNAFPSSSTKDIFSASQRSVSTSSPKAGNERTNTGHNRKLQIVLVIDQKVQKHLRVREMVRKDIETVSHSLNVNLKLIDFDRLDFGETKTLDTFYNADIALVDCTVIHQQPSLCYHVGVRESMGQGYNIIIMYMPDENADLKIMEAMKKTLSHLRLIVYFLSKDDQTTLLASDRSKLDLREMETMDFSSSMSQFSMSRKIRSKTFTERIKQALTSVQIEASAHAREKFLSDLRKVRDINTVDEANLFLERMRTRLDNPDVLSVDTVHQMLLSYRDTQNYDAMIKLIEDLEKLVKRQGVNQIVHAQAVRFLYAFALNRRNKGEDREKALKNVLKIIEDHQENIYNLAPDVICLAGRIYKDRFIASNYDDKEALEKAIEWYRKAFNVSPLAHSGINLTTLLRASGQQFEHNVELQQIAVVLNSLLGRKGALQNLTDYWDVATFFEVSVLAEDYNKACQAAQKMAIIKPPTWYLKSTMENIKLINRCAATLSPIEKEKQTFVFWTEFFYGSY